MQTTNEEVWEVKAKETWIDSFLSCHHQLPEKCNCPERRRELKMCIDRLLSTQEEKIRKDTLEKVKNVMWEGSKMRTATDFIEEFKERLNNL